MKSELVERFPLTLRQRQLATALVLAIASHGVIAQTSTPIAHDFDSAPTLSRADGTPLRVALKAWHAHASSNRSPNAGPKATLAVSNCADDGPGSLRATVATAANGDSIDLSALTCSRITLETGVIPVLLDDLTIVGPGARRLSIDGNASDRVFIHSGGGILTLRDISVSNGANHATGYDVAGGACIASAGTLILDQSTVSDCYAGGGGSYGGAIYAYGLIMTLSTLSNNRAYGVQPTSGTAAFGGAAFVYQLNLLDSTVSGNRAEHRANPPLPSYDIGGGIVTVLGGEVRSSTIDSNFAAGRGGGIATFSDISIVNSTASGNTAADFGGGALFVRLPANLALYNSTVTANVAHNGGGILIESSNTTIRSSIIAGNSADAGFPSDISADERAAPSLDISGANNLIGTVLASIAVPADSLHGDPALEPLASNGGPTRTHALHMTSVAIDAGNNVGGLAFDQRGQGYPREVGGAADIGAVERQSGAPAIVQTPVPTLSTWLLTVLAAMSVFVGSYTLRTRSMWQSIEIWRTKLFS